MCLYGYGFFRWGQLAASNFSRRFIGVQGRQSPIFVNFASPEAPNRTNQRTWGRRPPASNITVEIRRRKRHARDAPFVKWRGVCTYDRHVWIYVSSCFILFYMCRRSYGRISLTSCSSYGINPLKPLVVVECCVQVAWCGEQCIWFMCQTRYENCYQNVTVGRDFISVDSDKYSHGHSTCDLLCVSDRLTLTCFCFVRVTIILI